MYVCACRRCALKISRPFDTGRGRAGFWPRHAASRTAPKHVPIISFIIRKHLQVVNLVKENHPDFEPFCDFLTKDQFELIVRFFFTAHSRSELY